MARFYEGLPARARERGRRGGMEHFFHGYALNAIDAKGRVSIPADFRGVIERRSQSSTVILGPHPTVDCVVGYDRSYSAQLNEKLSVGRDPNSDDWDERTIAQFGMTEELAYDSTGRIVLTRTLREWGQLDTLGLFLGSSATFEIWNPRVLLKREGLNRRLAQLVRGLLADRGESE
jgi:MraZ protein